MRLLLIGDDDLANSVDGYARSWGAELIRLRAPAADALDDALADPVDGVVIVSRDDIRVLRLALLVEHSRPGVPILGGVIGELQAFLHIHLPHMLG